MNKILKEIEEKGYYLYSPEKWSEENSKIIENLLKDDLISSLKDENIEFINEDYYYILKGNKQNIKVVTKDNLMFLSS